MKGRSSKKRDIIIWTEGGKGIGLGHVRRCLVIAKELQKKDIDVLFFINDDPSATEWIEKEGFRYEIASLTEPLRLNTTATRKSLVMIDTKKPVAKLIKSLKKPGYKVVLMDNLTSARLDADAVIYPTTIYENNLDWLGFQGTVFGGSKYIPIAKSFVEMKKRTANKILHPPYQVLVTMGGSDPNHLTGKIVSALLKSQVPMNIRVIIGPAFSFDSYLDNLESQDASHVEFIRNTDDLSSVMAESHIAVTALGTTIFELAYLGIPSIIIANYKTEVADMIVFKKLEITLPLGYYKDVSDVEISHAVESLLSDKATWEKMSRKGRLLINGKGAERIANIIENILQVIEYPHGIRRCIPEK